MFEFTPWTDGGGVRMGLRPLTDARDWLRAPARPAGRLRARADLLRTQRHDVFGRLPGAAVTRALAEATTLLRAARGAGAPGATAPAEHGADEAAADDAFLAEAAHVHEDLCVLLPPAHGGPSPHDGLDLDWLLAAGVLCSASFWRLHEKLGHPLHRVHAPVAGLEQAIGARIRAFMRQLPPGRIFERGNWHLHTTGELHHPAPDDWTRAHGLDAGDIGGRLWLRCERQTLQRLPRSGAILFTILVYVQPLADLGAAPALARALWNAYLAMPEGERDARHFPLFKDALQAFVARL